MEKIKTYVGLYREQGSLKIFWPCAGLPHFVEFDLSKDSALAFKINKLSGNSITVKAIVTNNKQGTLDGTAVISELIEDQGFETCSQLLR